MRNLAFFLSLLATACSAQTFDRMYGNAYPWTEITSGRSIEQDSMFFTLYHQDEGNTNNGYMTFQAIDANGDTLFTRRLLDTQHPFSVLGFEKSLTGTDMYGCGFKQNLFPLPYTHAFLVRYNTVGDTLWYREYSNSDPYYNFVAVYQLYVEPDDQLVQLGFTVHDPVAPYDDQPYQLYLMKADAQGNRIWDRTYGDPLDNETPGDLLGLPDGGYLLMGYTYFNQVGPPYYNIKTFVLRTDSMGDQVYFNYLPGTNLALTCIAAMSDGNYIMGGTHCNEAIDSCGVALVKMDANGNILWERTLFPDSTHTGISVFEDIMQLPDGSFVGAGRSSPIPNNSFDAGLVMKTNVAGYQLWNRRIDKTPSYDTFTRITSTSDGGILLTGQAQRDQLSDVWLVKLDSLGCDSAGCPQVISTSVVPACCHFERSRELIAAPNPFSGSTLITFAPTTKGELLVRDALGRVVERVPVAVGSTSVEVTCRGMAAGVYVAALVEEGIVVGTVRLLVER